MKKMKFGILALICGAFFMFAGTASASTIMGAYINSNPGNLSTLVSVINSYGMDCDDSEGAPMLHYRYFTKPITASHSTCCTERNYFRSTTDKDIVTFDVAGQVNCGLAMFNDDTNYDSGGGAPNFDLPTSLGLTDARRGFMTINNTCGLVDYPEMEAGGLDGELMYLDIVNGAAWSDRMIYQEYMSPGAWFNECWFETMEEGYHEQLALYPPDEFLTKFIVTPLANDDNWMSGIHDMFLNNGNKQAKITRFGLYAGNDPDTLFSGVFDRDENTVSGGAPIDICCTAAVTLPELIGGSFGAWWDDEGGWAWGMLSNPTGLYSVSAAEIPDANGVNYNAIAYKLQYGSPSFAGGSMINSADRIRTWRGDGWTYTVSGSTVQKTGPSPCPSPCE
jgi:hypothetical protein